jgi:hypothetical protein
MAEDFSLGEAIGLQGRFDMAQKTAQAGIAAINARVKAAQKRAKDDEDFYSKIQAKMEKPKNLHHLFIEPASALGVDATARILKERSKGEGWRTKAAEITNELQESYAELENKSQIWKGWDDEFKRMGNYRTKDQIRVATAAREANDYMALNARAQKEEIPGYDPENTVPTGRVSYFAPKIDAFAAMNKEFSKIALLEGKPTVKKIAGKDQISQEKILFLYDKDAKNYAKLNNITTPQSIESTSRNLLDNNPTFRYQYADELNMDPMDTDALVQSMMEVGSKYVVESEKLKSPGTEYKFSIYNSPQNEGTPAAVNKRIGQFTDKENTYVNFGSGVVQIEPIKTFNPTGNTVDGKGVLRTTAISNATPQEVVVLPYILDKDKTTSRSYEKPLIIGGTTPLTSLDLQKAYGFQAYIKLSTPTGIEYVPADEFQDTQYVKGSQDFVNQQVATLSKYKDLGLALDKYHNTNKGNANAELYKLYKAYAANPTANEAALNKFITDNF